MSSNKTTKNDLSVDAFIDGVENQQQQADCRVLIELMKEITKDEPKMWVPSIVGFGDFHYKYAGGREGDWFYVGFSPRKQNLTMYIMDGFNAYSEYLAKLGKFKTGKSCLYVKKLDDVNMDVLQGLIEASVKHQVAGDSGR